jgi:2-dehydropantoate 2-reductase
METPFGRFLILGAGALGSLLGGYLAGAYRVLLLGRGTHIAALRADGLRVGGLSDLRLPLSDRLQALDTAAHQKWASFELRPEDTVLLTVKARHVRDALTQLAEKVRPSNHPLKLVTFQNGTGFEDLVTRFCQTHQAETTHVVAFRGATLNAPGQVDDWGGPLLCAARGWGAAVGRAFQQAGLEVQFLEDLNRARWKKIAFNCALNPLAALLQVRNRETLEPAWEGLQRGVLAEAHQAAAWAGVDLPSLGLLWNEFCANVRASNNVNSMAQDVCGGKPTEMDYLNGAIARAHQNRGVRAVCCEGLAALFAQGLSTDVRANRVALAQMVRDVQLR